MKYPVPCECGQIHRVAATLAGSQLACACGREVAIPSLSKLKANAGQAPLSAELRIQHMLQLGMLPEERACRLCDVETDHTFYCWAVCEKVEVKAGRRVHWWFVVLVALSMGLIWTVGTLLIYIRRRADETEVGRDVRYRLPLRICNGCTARMTDYVTLKDTFWSVPVYRELLDKYPDTALAFDAERKGVTL
jgi:hypothetical protein